MGHYRFVVQVGASREQVFDLWTDLDRAHEWIEGLTRITDVTGPVTTAGTRYIVWFGRLRSPTEVLQVDRPRLVRTLAIAGFSAASSRPRSRTRSTVRV